MKNKHMFQWSSPLDLCPPERRAGPRSRPEHRTLTSCTSLTVSKYTYWFCGFRLFDWACPKTQSSCSERTAHASHHYQASCGWATGPCPCPATLHPHKHPPGPSATLSDQEHAPSTSHNNRKETNPPSRGQWCSPHIITGFEMQQKAFKT